MTAPQAKTGVEVERRHAELIDTLRGYSVLAAPGALAQQLDWAADVITELVRDMSEDLRDRKEADEMLRQIGATLSNQTEFTGSYAEIVVKILAALAAERAEAVRMREALEEIALAGMSPSPEMSEDGVRAWHARQAWQFIGIAARAISPIDAALSPSQGAGRDA